MNELKVFENSTFGRVRTVTINDEPWFLGKDVAVALGYSNTQKAIRDHVDNEDKLPERIVLAGQNREVIIINESGLYSLILSSKLPQAKEFKHWVTSEVLPAIRKTGGYIAGQESMTDLELVSRAFLVIHKQLEERNAQVKTLTAENEKLRPAADYAAECLMAKNCMMTTVIAKELGMSAERLNEILRLLGVQYKQGGQWFLKSKYQDKGYTDVKTTLLHRKDGTTETSTITVWTQKGKQFVIGILAEHGYIVKKRPTRKAVTVRCRNDLPMFNGERLKTKMRDMDISMKALSRMTGITCPMLTKYRDGKVLPSLRTREFICSALGVNKTYFDFS